MLRVTGVSLLLGFAALVVILTQFYAPPTTGTGLPPITWNESNVRLDSPKKQIVDGELQIKIRRSGSNFVTLDTGGINADDYAFMHLAIENPPEDLTTAVALNFNGNWMAVQPHKLHNESPTSVWLAMHELEGWSGTINSVTVTFSGRRGEIVRVKKFGLYPSTPIRQLQAIYLDLTGNAPWRRADMNTHTGVAKESSFYPVPLAAALLLLSTFAYGVLLLLLPQRSSFSWKVVGLIFLACWVALDLVWQNRLLYQVAHSQRLFAGKDSPEKLAEGPDGELYNFIAAARQYIQPQDARVFVATTDSYRGMRGAYFLYPFNAFWRFEPPEIPRDHHLRKGDYVVLIRPSDTRFTRGKNRSTLKGPEHPARPVERLYSDDTGTLVRLK